MSNEVSGAKLSLPNKTSGESSVYKSSDELEYDHFSCDPCKSVGDNAKAVGYCRDCQEYLCDKCLRSHSRSKLSKSHILLNDKDMPRKTEHVCEPCKFAGDEKQAIGYCKDCLEFLCEECFKSHSRSKLSRHHVLVHKSGMSQNFVASSVVNVNANEGSYVDVNDVVKIRDVNIRIGSDKGNCYIVDMALLMGSGLILFDKNNSCLKYFGVDNSLKDTFVFEGEICGMTAISMDQVAAAVYDKYQIQIFNIRGKISKARTIKTNGKCLDVKMMKEKLYVSYNNPVRFQILKLNGVLLKTIQPEEEVLKQCTHPRHIAVTGDEKVIYASDFKTNKVIAINMSGQMIALHSDELDKPYGILLSPSGSVFVCNREQHVVYKMTPSLSELTIVLGPGDSLKHPQAIAFDQKMQHIYISCGTAQNEDGNLIGVYQLK